MESPFKGGRLRVFSADYIVVEKAKIIPLSYKYSTFIVAVVVVTQKKTCSTWKKTPEHNKIYIYNQLNF